MPASSGQHSHEQAEDEDDDERREVERPALREKVADGGEDGLGDGDEELREGRAPGGFDEREEDPPNDEELEREQQEPQEVVDELRTHGPSLAEPVPRVVVARAAMVPTLPQQ